MVYSVVIFAAIASLHWTSAAPTPSPWFQPRDSPIHALFKRDNGTTPDPNNPSKLASLYLSLQQSLIHHPRQTSPQITPTHRPLPTPLIYHPHGPPSWLRLPYRMSLCRHKIMGEQLSPALLPTLEDRPWRTNISLADIPLTQGAKVVRMPTSARSHTSAT